MKWFAVILILIAMPADANFLNGYALNGSVLVGYVLKIRIGGICIGGIRLRLLLMHTFWMDTFAMDTYWWDTFGRDTFGMDMCGICMMCWICMGYVWWLVGYVLQPFEWIRIAWIRTGGIRMGGIRLEWICVGYVRCAGYVWDMCGGYVWNGYVWDMCDVLDMCGICVVWDTQTIFWRTLRRNVFREKLSLPKWELVILCKLQDSSFDSRVLFVFVEFGTPEVFQFFPLVYIHGARWLNENCYDAPELWGPGRGEAVWRDSIEGHRPYVCQMRQAGSQMSVTAAWTKWMVLKDLRLCWWLKSGAKCMMESFNINMLMVMIISSNIVLLLLILFDIRNMMMMMMMMIWWRWLVLGDWWTGMADLSDHKKWRQVKLLSIGVLDKRHHA